MLLHPKDQQILHAQDAQAVDLHHAERSDHPHQQHINAGCLSAIDDQEYSLTKPEVAPACLEAAPENKRDHHWATCGFQFQDESELTEDSGV